MTRMESDKAFERRISDRILMCLMAGIGTILAVGFLVTRLQ